MKIEIKSRQKIEGRASMPFILGTALISITDHGDSFAELKYKSDYLLQLAFDDVYWLRRISERKSGTSLPRKNANRLKQETME